MKKRRRMRRALRSRRRDENRWFWCYHTGSLDQTIPECRDRYTPLWRCHTLSVPASNGICNGSLYQTSPSACTCVPHLTERDSERESEREREGGGRE